MTNKRKGKSISLRLTLDEEIRFEEVGARFSGRNAFANKSDMIRVWLELERPELLSDDERAYLLGKIAALPSDDKEGSQQGEIAGNGTDGKSQDLPPRERKSKVRVRKVTQ